MSKMKYHLLLGLGALSLLAAACTPMDAEDDTFDELGQGQGQPEEADWSCVGEATSPPPTDFPRTVTYTFPLVDWVTDAAIPGRTIQVCNRIDTTCASPLPAMVDIRDNSREVSVEVPTGQPIYLRLTATDRIPTILYFDGPLYADQPGGRIQLLTLPVIGSLAASARIPLDPTLGVLAIRPHDCAGKIVDGALYSITDASNSSIPYTMINGLVRAEDPAVPNVRTTIPSDYSPWAGYTNVPPLGITVSGTLAEDNLAFGTADAQVFGGYVNAIEVRALNRL